MIAGDSLEALRESYEASRRQLQSLMEQQGRLRDAADAMALDARAAVERIARALCPGLVDDYCKESPDGLSRIATPDLADAVIRDAQRRLLRLAASAEADKSASRSYGEISAQAERLRQKVDSLQLQLERVTQEKDTAETRLVVLEAQLEDARQRLAGGQGALSLPEVAVAGESPVMASVPDERLPEWLRVWRESDAYERDRDLLRLLAETGIARRSEATRVLAAMWDKSVRDGTFSRLFKRCAGKLGIIALEEAASETSGSGKQHLLYLTERGRDACRLDLGLKPVASQYSELMKRHRSKEHVLLNLEAGDLLRDAGYTVDLFPAPSTLPSGGRFEPDLAASLNGHTLFVEVERDTRKDQVAWARKWEIVYEATDGEIYVVVANKRALDSVRSGIVYSIGKRPMTLCLTSVSDARGKGLQGDDVWIDRWGKR